MDEIDQVLAALDAQILDTRGCIQEYRNMPVDSLEQRLRVSLVRLEHQISHVRMKLGQSCD